MFFFLSPWPGDWPRSRSRSRTRSRPGRSRLRSRDCRRRGSKGSIIVCSLLENVYYVNVLVVHPQKGGGL